MKKLARGPSRKPVIIQKVSKYIVAAIREFFYDKNSLIASQKPRNFPASAIASRIRRFDKTGRGTANIASLRKGQVMNIVHPRAIVSVCAAAAMLLMGSTALARTDS